MPGIVTLLVNLSLSFGLDYGSQVTKTFSLAGWEAWVVLSKHIAVEMVF